MAPGTRLRAAREARGLDLAAVAQGTHIPQEALLALEEGRYAELPPLVYVRGFVRQYATLVGLPADELVVAVDQAAPAPAPAGHQPLLENAPPTRRTPDFGLTLGSLALLVVALGLAAIVLRRGGSPAVWSAGRPVATPTSTALPLAFVAVPTVTPLPSRAAQPILASPSLTTQPTTTTATVAAAPTTIAIALTATPVPPPATAVSTARTAASTPTARPASHPPVAPLPPSPTAVPAHAETVVVPPTAVPAPVVTAVVEQPRFSTTYTVKRGDTLIGLARRLGVTDVALARANGLRNPNDIRAGQALLIP